jgi:hypothetical protein
MKQKPQQNQNVLTQLSLPCVPLQCTNFNRHLTRYAPVADDSVRILKKTQARIELASLGRQLMAMNLRRGPTLFSKMRIETAPAPRGRNYLAGENGRV